MSENGRTLIAKWFSALKERGLDLLYPPALYCICCGNLIDETRTYHLCDHCISHIRWDAGDVRVLNGIKTLRCAEYGLYARTLIFALKYNGKTYIARDLAEIMADRLAMAGPDFDVIVPVPLFSRKEKKRGFNQAALIGDCLGKLTGRPCISRGLLRTEDTRPMRGLSPMERKINVKGKFAVNKKYVTLLEGQRILLLDDFFTTGSTAGQCISALEEVRPADVHLLAFAAR